MLPMIVSSNLALGAVKLSRNQILLISKGAVTETLDICSRVQSGNKTTKLTPKMKNHINQIAEDMNADGLRVVGVACKYLKNVPKELSVKNEVYMTFVGYVAFLDPPKDSAEEIC